MKIVKINQYKTYYVKTDEQDWNEYRRYSDNKEYWERLYGESWEMESNQETINFLNEAIETSNKITTLSKLKKGLKVLIGTDDSEKAHIEADKLLLEFINDDEVKEIFDEIGKW